MSNEELRQQLKGIQSAYDSDYDVVESVTREGLSSLKSKIRGMDIQFEDRKPVQAPEKKAKFTALDIANRATATYKEKIRPEVEKPDAGTTPITHATRTSMRAMASSLAGMRTSGNAGKHTQSTSNGNGDLGQYTSSANNNDGDLGNNTAHGQYFSLTTSMSLEQYEEHISKKFLGEEVETAEPLVCKACGQDPCVCEEEFDALGELQDRLLQLEDSAWQSIDMVMREMAHELDVTPKELHKHFKHETGQIPDEWIKDNVKVEQCGWFPMHEAVVNRNGHAFDVSMYWKGHTRRLKFFWPDLKMPKREAMQKAAEMFYPGCRLLAFYPTREDNNDFMVMVPPMSENYEFIPIEAYTILTEEQNDILNQIEEEEGEIVSGVEMDDEGHLTFFISDNETGEERQVIVEDDMKGMSQKSGDKRSTESGAGLTAKGVAKYRAKNPGSKLKTAVTGKVKAGSKAAGRRKSFCARSRGWNGERGKAARRRWKC